jgi:SAM-dependent methyltransferase
VHDSWAAGASYEDFMGRWSRRLADRFVSWLDIPPGGHWLDVGCGTGSLTHAICTRADPASVTGCDPAAAFIQFAQDHNRDARATFDVAGVDHLPHRPDGFDCVASLLALNFFPDADLAVRDMGSVAGRGGTVSACVWDYAGGMEFLRHFWNVAATVDAAARALDEGERFPDCHPDGLTRLFRAGGLADVRCDAIEIPTTFASFEDYWKPFLGGTGPAPAFVASLDADRRAILSGRLEETLPRGPDGGIALMARAWAVRGTNASLFHSH